jgi:hypothetical protein
MKKSSNDGHHHGDTARFGRHYCIGGLYAGGMETGLTPRTSEHLREYISLSVAEEVERGRNAPLAKYLPRRVRENG